MEHAVLGKPQVVPANSANLELYDNDRGFLVPIHHYETNTKILTEGAVVHPQHVFQTLEHIYHNKEKGKEVGQKAREYFLQDKFRWENIAQQFIDVIE
jgi:glycosyltransferase involved in cell wall biosynthesis